MIEELQKLGHTLALLKNNSKKEYRQQLLKQSVHKQTSVQARLWQYMLSPFLTYGISKIPNEFKDNHSRFYRDTDQLTLTLINLESLGYEHFVELIHGLSTRYYSGEEAKGLVRQFYLRLETADEKRAFKAIIERKPNCQCGAKNINTVFPGLIPVFSIMKPRAWKDRGVHAQALCKKGAFVDTKEKGFHTVYEYDTNKLMLSSGAETKGFPYMNAYLQQVLSPGTVLFCELVHREGFEQKLKEHISDKIVNNETAPVDLVVFDALPMSDWICKGSIITQTERREWLDNADFGPAPWLKKIKYWFVSNVADLDFIYYSIIDQGGEGVVVKNPKGVYRFKRHDDWIKRKKELSFDLPIVDILPGDSGSKFEHTLGRLVVITEGGVRVQVAPGRMTDKLRNTIWSSKDQYIGRVIEVLCNEITNDGSMQHPRFYRFRDDKILE